MKNFLSISAFAAVAGLAGLAQAADLRLSHFRPVGTPLDIEMHEFADAVSKATNGNVNIEIFAASALGDYTNVQESISVGAIDMALQPAATGADRRLQFSTLPYLATNWKQAGEIFGPDSVVGDAMEGFLAEQNITVLAGYPAYFGSIALNKTDVSPTTTEPNGIKIRVPGIKTFQLTAEALGYIPSPIPFSDAYTSVQTGVVDGVIGSGAEGYYASFRDVTKTYVPVNDHFEYWFMMINTDSFNALSEEDRAAMLKVAEQFEVNRWVVAEQQQSEWEKKLVEDTGATMVSFSDEQLSSIAKDVRDKVWPKILDDIGADWAQPLLDKISQ